LKQSFTTCKLLDFKNFESLVFGAFLSKTENVVVFLLALFVSIAFLKDKKIPFAVRQAPSGTRFNFCLSFPALALGVIQIGSFQVATVSVIKALCPNFFCTFYFYYKIIGSSKKQAEDLIGNRTGLLLSGLQPVILSNFATR
jgi:hypothetical protein